MCAPVARTSCRPCRRRRRRGGCTPARSGSAARPRPGARRAGAAGRRTARSRRGRRTRQAREVEAARPGADLDDRRRLSRDAAFRVTGTPCISLLPPRRWRPRARCGRSARLTAARCGARRACAVSPGRSSAGTPPRRRASSTAVGSPALELLSSRSLTGPASRAGEAARGMRRGRRRGGAAWDDA